MYKSMRKLDPRIGSQAIWASFPFPLKIDAQRNPLNGWWLEVKLLRLTAKIRGTSCVRFLGAQCFKFEAF